MLQSLTSYPYIQSSHPSLLCLINERSNFYPPTFQNIPYVTGKHTWSFIRRAHKPALNSLSICGSRVMIRRNPSNVFLFFFKINLFLDNAIYDAAQSSLFIFPPSCYLPCPHTCQSSLLPLSPHPVFKLSFNFYFMTPECNQGQSHEPGCWAIDWRMSTLCVAISVKTMTSFSSAALSARKPFPSVTDCAWALSCGDPLQAAAAAVELMVALRSSKEGTTLILWLLLKWLREKDVGLGLTCMKNPPPPPGRFNRGIFVSNCISYISDLFH